METLPVLQGILPVKRSRILTDVAAGATLAALSIPVSMGYAKIAGAPVTAGLYTMLAPMFLFALFGSSRHLVVGADSATAVILFAGLSAMAIAPASAKWTAYSGALALMAGGLLLMSRIIRIGFLADFLSRTVLVGFLTGVGVQVAIGEIPGMLGFAGGGLGSIGAATNAFRQINHAAVTNLAVSAGALLTIVATARISKRIPGALIAVIGSIAASSVFHLRAEGVRVLGAIPRGLPAVILPEIRWSWGLIERLLPIAFSLFIVTLAQSAATSRAYAARHNEQFSQNTDLLGLGLANIGAALTGTFIVNGSPTKTQMVETAGGLSQLAQVASCVFVFLVLLFLTPPLSYLPDATLSAVVFLIGIELIDIRGMRRIFFERPWEFWVASITALAVIFTGVRDGIITAMFLSIVAHTRHGYRPKNAVIMADEGERFRPVPVSSPRQLAPGLMVYRFTHSMYYANAEQLFREITGLAGVTQPRLKWFCIDAGAVDDVDFSAAETLLQLAANLKLRGIRLVLAEASEHLREELDRSRLTALIGEGSYYATLSDVLKTYLKQPLPQPLRQTAPPSTP